jgi:hypothetical protein
LSEGYAVADEIYYFLKPYTEPSKHPQLTPEEIKALKLARDCGFSEIRCGGELELTEVRAVNDDRCHSDWVLAYKIPALENLTQGRRSFQITSNPMSISELLNDEVDK